MKKAIIFILAAFACCHLSAQTREQRLTDHVYYLASDAMNGRKAGSEDAAKARKYIIAEYEKAGIQPYFKSGWEMPFMDGEYTNVVGFIEGSDPEMKNEYIVLGAHYDHLGVKNDKIYNGADDNASGTAALIEVAGYLASCREQIKRSVIIAAFDAEELGLYGSKALAAQLDSTIGSSCIKLMMSIDMVGWLKEGKALEIEGISTIKNGKALLQAQADALQLPIKGKAFENSILTATDTEYFAKNQVPTLAISTGLKSPYHKPEDDPELIDYPGLDKVTEYIGDIALEFSNSTDFAPSGKVATKHRNSARPFLLGVTASLGTGSLSFPDAAFMGKSSLSYEAGLSTRINFGKKGIICLQTECLFNRTAARYPDTDDLFGSSLDYTRESITIPVSVLLHTSQRGAVGGCYFGAGGFWSKSLDSTLPVDYPLLEDSFGSVITFGFEFGHITLEYSGRYFMADLFTNDKAPSAKLINSFAVLKYFF